MKRKLIGIVICMLVVAPVTFLVQGQYTTPNLTSSPRPAAIIDVTIQDFFFSPTPVTINVGDTVRWTNNGPSQHSSTSDTGVWNSGILSVGQTFSFTFNTAGTYAYHCTIHPSMHGSVVVNGPNNPPNTPTEPGGPATRVVGQSGTYSTMTTDPNGDQVQYRFDWDATGAHDISAWSALVPSGQTVSMSHAWSSAGTYVVEAQAMDSLSAMSGWSTGLTVTVSSSGNTPPETPTTPVGPTSLNVSQSGSYSTSAIDPDGDQVQYRFDFDANGAHAYSAYTALMPSGQTGSMSFAWNVSGTYVVASQARDAAGFTSNWSSGLTVVVGANQPPSTPTVTGPSTGTKGVPIDFTATTTDPEGDMIQYYFDFGDGTNSGWLPMVNSGTAAQVNHTFTKGTYTVKAKARDTSLAESAYGSLSIKIPTSVGFIPQMTLLRLFFLKIAQFFPIFEKFIHVS